MLYYFLLFTYLYAWDSCLHLKIYELSDLELQQEILMVLLNMIQLQTVLYIITSQTKNHQKYKMRKNLLPRKNLCEYLSYDGCLFVLLLFYDLYFVLIRLLCGYDSEFFCFGYYLLFSYYFSLDSLDEYICFYCF